MKESIFLYVRDSMGKEESLKGQQEELLEFAKKEFIDFDVSIYKDTCSCTEERNGLMNLINDIEKKKAKYVLVVHSNRLYRIYPDKQEEGIKKLNEIFDKIKEKGAEIISVRELPEKIYPSKNQSAEKIKIAKRMKKRIREL